MENFDDMNGFFNKKNIIQYFSDYKSGKNKDKLSPKCFLAKFG